MEQLVARWIHNPKVGGSSPSPATKSQKEVPLSTSVYSLKGHGRVDISGF